MAGKTYICKLKFQPTNKKRPFNVVKRQHDLPSSNDKQAPYCIFQESTGLILVSSDVPINPKQIYDHLIERVHTYKDDIRSLPINHSIKFEIVDVMALSSQDSQFHGSNFHDDIERNLQFKRLQGEQCFDKCLQVNITEEQLHSYTAHQKGTFVIFK